MKWVFDKKEPWLSGFKKTEDNFRVDNTQAVGYRMRHGKQAAHHTRAGKGRPQGASSALQGVQGQAQQAGPQGMAQGGLVKTFDANTRAPQSVVEEINAVLNGDVWDHELAFYDINADEIASD